MGDTTDELVRLAHEISPRPRARELDMLISVGERISCSLCAMAIHDLGHQAISLTGSQAGIVTDTAHGKAKIVDIRAKRIHEALDAERIVLVAGFQGVSTDLDITTLGRGGSDTTAVALAAGPRRRRLRDLHGRRRRPHGRSANRPERAQAARGQLRRDAGNGRVGRAGAPATVGRVRAQPRCQAARRSSFSEADGTWIREEDERMLEKALISGVTHKSAETVYRVEGVSAARLFDALAEAGVNVDTVIQTGPEIVFSADEGPEAQDALGSLGVEWSAREDLGQVSVIGAGMKSHPGVAAKMFSALDELGIQPVIVSTSPIKIGCFVARDQVEQAVQALHAAFELERPEAERPHA
jgi:aspartate kinase